MCRLKLKEKIEAAVGLNTASEDNASLTPFTVTTIGDLTNYEEQLQIGVTQGGPSWPSLLKLLINDLPPRLKETTNRRGEGTNIKQGENVKLVTDNIILLARNKNHMEALLRTCTLWANEMGLKWKAKK